METNLADGHEKAQKNTTEKRHAGKERMTGAVCVVCSFVAYESLAHRQSTQDGGILLVSVPGWLTPTGNQKPPLANRVWWSWPMRLR
jgi:hypothetical protein